MNARGEMRPRLFPIFCAQGQSEFLVAMRRDLQKRLKRSCTDRKRTTPSIQRTRGDGLLPKEAEQYDLHKDQQWKLMLHSYSRSFDAVYAWTSRDRVIIKKMTAYLARERQDVFVEMEEMEKHMLSPADTEGNIGVLAWGACEHQGRRRLVAVEREEDDAGGNCETVCDGRQGM